MSTKSPTLACARTRNAAVTSDRGEKVAVVRPLMQEDERRVYMRHQRGWGVSSVVLMLLLLMMVLVTRILLRMRAPGAVDYVTEAPFRCSFTAPHRNTVLLH